MSEKEKEAVLAASLAVGLIVLVVGGGVLGALVNPWFFLVPCAVVLFAIWMSVYSSYLADHE